MRSKCISRSQRQWRESTTKSSKCLTIFAPSTKPCSSRFTHSRNVDRREESRGRSLLSRTDRTLLSLIGAIATFTLTHQTLKTTLARGVEKMSFWPNRRRSSRSKPSLKWSVPRSSPCKEQCSILLCMWTQIVKNRLTWLVTLRLKQVQARLK